jgi:hypothetical protein
LSRLSELAALRSAPEKSPVQTSAYAQLGGVATLGCSKRWAGLGLGFGKSSSGSGSKESRRKPKAAASLDLEVSAGWAGSSSRGLWGGDARLPDPKTNRPQPVLAHRALLADLLLKLSPTLFAVDRRPAASGMVVRAWRW